MNKSTPAYTLDIAGNINYTFLVSYFSNTATTGAGALLIFYYNYANNKQFCIADASLLDKNANNPMIRFVLQPSSGIVDCIPTNNTYLQLTIQNVNGALTLRDPNVMLTSDNSFTFYNSGPYNSICFGATGQIRCNGCNSSDNYFYFSTHQQVYQVFIFIDMVLLVQQQYQQQT